MGISEHRIFRFWRVVKDLAEFSLQEDELAHPPSSLPSCLSSDWRTKPIAKKYTFLSQLL
jgi:hypothetical protein